MSKTKAIAQAAPMQTPKTEPKVVSKRAPEVSPDNSPKRRPQRVPKVAPVIAPASSPETSTLSIYSLPEWEADHSINPHRYGNKGKSLGEFHTEGDAKDWLRRNGCEGHFAAVERINGRIGKSWHIEIELWDEETGDELEMLDEDDLDDAQLLNPDVVRAKIENAKLKAELKARSQNGSHSSFIEMMQGFKLLNEMHGPGSQQKSLTEQLREFKEANELINPKREPSQPQPPQSQLSDDAVILNALANNNAVAGKVKEMVRNLFTGKTDKEEITFADVAMEAVKNGELSKTVEAAVSGLGSLLVSFLPNRAGQQPPPAQPMQTQPDAQGPQHNTQMPQDNLMALTLERLTGRILPAMETNDDVIPVVNSLISFCDLFPEHAPMIEGWMKAPAPGLLAMLSQNVPNAQQATSKPHAVDWTQRLQAAFFADDEEDEATGQPNAEMSNQSGAAS